MPFTGLYNVQYGNQHVKPKQAQFLSGTSQNAASFSQIQPLLMNGETLALNDQNQMHFFGETPQ